MFDKAYIRVRGNRAGDRIAIAKIGERGYFATDLDRRDYTDAQVDELVDILNERLEIDRDTRLSFELGSCFGWDTPAAKKALAYQAKHV